MQTPNQKAKSHLPSTLMQIQVYGSVRKSAVDASFRRLEVEKLSIGDVQRLEWEQLEAKIRRWIRAAKVCVRTLFASEKRLCEQIFYGVGTAIDDTCFMETVKGPAFNFSTLLRQLETLGTPLRTFEKPPPRRVCRQPGRHGLPWRLRRRSGRFRLLMRTPSPLAKLVKPRQIYPKAF